MVLRSLRIEFFRNLLDDLTEFIGAALKAGNAAIVVATKLHRDGLLPRLQTYGLNIGTAIEQGRYVALDAADTLSTFMLNGMPDLVRFMKLFGDVVATASEAAKADEARVAISRKCVISCGHMVTGRRRFRFPGRLGCSPYG